MADLAPHRLLEIENFFVTYKTLEKRESRVEGWLEIDDAWRIIDEAIEMGSREVTADSPQPGTWR
jgi:inorganic pyrophosphatase